MGGRAEDSRRGGTPGFPFGRHRDEGRHRRGYAVSIPAEGQSVAEVSYAFFNRNQDANLTNSGGYYPLAFKMPVGQVERHPDAEALVKADARPGDSRAGSKLRPGQILLMGDVSWGSAWRHFSSFTCCAGCAGAGAESDMYREPSAPSRGRAAPPVYPSNFRDSVIRLPAKTSPIPGPF